MANLDDIMNTPEAPAYEKVESPQIKIDWENKALEVIRFRFLKDLNKLETLIRHYVPELRRYVMCNQQPGLKDVKDKAGKKTGVKEPTIWSHGFVDGERVPHCKYCEAKAQLKRDMEANAFNEFTNGQRADGKLSKEEGIELGKIYKKQTVLVAPVEAEKRIGSEVTEPLAGRIILFVCYDLFFPQFDAQYKQLKSKFNNKKTLLDHWFILNGEGMVDLDDKLTKAEKSVEVEVDEEFFVRQTLTYEEAMEKEAEKKAAADEATPNPKAKKAEKALDTNDGPPLEDDGDIPY